MINEPPLQVLPSLAVKVGLQEAIVLQQIHYWVQMAKPKSGECWVYNTYEQWAIQFPFWSSEAIRKIFKNLREKGLVLSRPRGLHAFDRVNEYTIDYERLGLLDAEKFTASSVTAVPDHAEKFTASGRTNLPSLYTETTQETPQAPKGAGADGFAEFWTIYPKKVGKDAAEKSWNRKVKTKATAEEVMTALKAHTKNEAWARDGGQYIPNPATWLNQGRWKDELAGEVAGSQDWSKGAV